MFRKWIELIPMYTKSTLEVALAFNLHVVARFGIPLEIRVDPGTHFAGHQCVLC